MADTMKVRIEVGLKGTVEDPEGNTIANTLKLLGFSGVDNVRLSKIYTIEGDFSEKDVEEMCRKLLVNPVINNYRVTYE